MRCIHAAFKNLSVMKSKTYFWIHCFIVALILVLGAILGVDASNSNPSKEFRKRQAECTAEQHRIQHQGIKKFNAKQLNRKLKKHSKSWK